MKIIFAMFIFFLSMINSFSEEKTLFNNNLFNTLSSNKINLLDFGLIRFEEDLTSYVKNHLDEENVITNVYYDWRNERIIASISFEQNYGFSERNYLSTSYKCRDYFVKTVDMLTQNSGYGDGKYSKASSYLSDLFASPTTQYYFAVDEQLRKSLVESTYLEITIRPTKELAFEQNVSPMRCLANLKANFDDIEVVLK
tara:strand:+ start:175 stop:768 length:594 start_codon:yes stop_codon:yes gene_type:complete